jgi:hypothetical protein
LKTLVAMMQDGDNPGSDKAEAARKAFGDIALAIRRLVAAARMGQEMEQLVLGEPTSIVALDGEIGVRPVVAANATAEEIAAAAEAALRAADEMRSLEAAKKGADDADGSTKLAN